MKKSFDDIRAISLDAMGTILFLKKPPQDIYFEVLRELGYDPQKILPLTMDRELFRRYWQQAERILPPSFLNDHVDRFAHYRETPYAFWGLIFEAMFTDLKLPKENLFAAVDAAYRRFGAPDLWAVEPTLVELVDFCREYGIKLFVTSNWDFRLPKIIRELGIAAFFSEIITSALVGYEKPSPKIFQYLATSAGCAARQVLHIGDRIKDDVQGAIQAGLQAALYRKDDNLPDNDFSFPCVRSLKQIRDIVN